MGDAVTRFVVLSRLGLILILGIIGLACGGSKAASINDVFAVVATRVPEFGGVHVDDERDILYLHLHNGGSAAAQAALAELKAAFGDQRLGQRRVQVVPATFGFLKLKQWHDQLAMELLRSPGVVFTGIDDASNRVVIGVEDVKVRSMAEPLLAQLGIPPEAVNFLETGPVEFSQASLQDRHRPLVGGLEIGSTTGSGTCTLGFIARRAGVLGFVTASHCSSRRGEPPGIVGSVYTQPFGGGGIGVETVDPPFHGCYCIFGLCAFRCRNSDSSFSRLDSPASAALGLIASPAIGNPSWDGVSTFVVAGGTSPFVGAKVSKIGRTTGRTDGIVLLTGLTIPIGSSSFPFFTRKLLQNQVFASYVQDTGDSGAPVIIVGSSVASLEGISWGGLGRVVAGAPGALFSPIGGVQADLGGPLMVAANPKADLVAISPPDSTQFCRVVGGQRRVVVRVANTGGAFAPASFTRIDFPGFPPPSELITLGISPGGSRDLDPIEPPFGCSNPDCNFVITVDSRDSVDEGSAGEGNNTVLGSCPG